MPVASVRDVSVAFRGRGRVLEHVSLELEPGARVALVGPSGSGKSTLLGVLGLTLVPDEGDTYVGGQRITGRGHATRLRRECIGWVLQQPVLYSARTAAENVALASFVDGVPWRVASANASEWLARVGLAERAATSAGRLSGGERQRVAVARALSMRPPLLLADEPTAGLDPALARSIASLIFEHAPVESAVVVATHDPHVATAAASTIRITDGRLVRA